MDPEEVKKAFNPEDYDTKEQLKAEVLWRMQYLKTYALDDLYLFNTGVLEVEEGDKDFVKLAPFHKELCNFITDRKDKKKLILIPRGHLKSRLITVGYPIQQMLKNNKIRILIYSATWSTASDLVTAIQKQLQPGTTYFDWLTNIWGDLSQGAREWSQDKIRLAKNDKRESTVTAAGIDNNLVGGHYDIIIMDDVVNRDNIGTADQINKVIQKYRDSLDLLEPNGQLIVIGTRWHFGDLYGWILDNPEVKSAYEVMIKEAFSGNIVTGEGFEPLWPEKFSLKELQGRLAEEGWSHFSAQYLNNPVPEENATFKRGWFHYYEPDLMRGRLLNKFMAIDPALSLEKSGDYTGMVVVGQDEHGYIYILDIVRVKMSPSDIINEIFRMRDKWGLTDIGIEQVAFQKALAYSLRTDDRFQRHPFHITELKPNERSKDQRIKGLQPLYENGKILHNKLLGNNVYLEDELTRFPNNTHDDVVDALSYCLDFIFPARQKADRRSKGRQYLY